LGLRGLDDGALGRRVVIVWLQARRKGGSFRSEKAEVESGIDPLAG